jgi:hypothetical protein
MEVPLEKVEMRVDWGVGGLGTGGVDGWVSMGVQGFRGWMFPLVGDFRSVGGVDL